MFGLFKRDPVKSKRKEYDYLLETAMHAQRRGDIMTYSMLSADADKLWREIEDLELQQK
ncbi:Lacal_2735 family protein [Alginatibacterium sediminis]|uniref:Lacal_2735 family protein n=1 Tax=Alginatibacterium sediminis TaxID=2164068 RepID=A0A420EHB3_9ALTE|nr:DUF6435 family protein [Alginatibacterium sediminis]RKF20058.1 Lacal_2735 family protein [Alginatibacterium sediminis]